ncbi:predicted protein [Pyrenophora tritici-repentis Pt-1C-BFP]|uniref:Uncharacterized protein n=1 Tax=Pyrenophora tritici-repentis (strain Pt-1C-BFP) TaxID=426418 RepID=B2WFH0_PYRTR|nr:uncharacterized protein PTRG_09238 [Pyrenophora tritici-repentis Pt-1C-BFP]EDU42289.1 predicted protein [Pyrenophora tritici-repentis Pt-1C-BFP]
MLRAKIPEVISTLFRSFSCLSNDPIFKSFSSARLFLEIKLYFHVLSTLYLIALASAWCGKPINRREGDHIIELEGKDPCSGNSGANKFCHGGVCAFWEFGLLYGETLEKFFFRFYGGGNFSFLQAVQPKKPAHHHRHETFHQNRPQDAKLTTRQGPLTDNTIDIIDKPSASHPELWFRCTFAVLSPR